LIFSLCLALTLKNIDKLRKQLIAIKSELQDLEKFRDSKELRKFRRILHGESSNIKETIHKITETQESKDKRRMQRMEIANKNRSSKNKRNWNYVKSIRENYFPDKSLKDIRTSLKNHRKGLETDIPDVAWKNPSP